MCSDNGINLGDITEADAIAIENRWAILRRFLFRAGQNQRLCPFPRHERDQAEPEIPRLYRPVYENRPVPREISSITSSPVRRWLAKR